MIVVDAHQDIAYNKLVNGREYRMSALQKREREAESWLVQVAGRAANGLPEAIAGRVGVVFATIFTAPHAASGSALWERVAYRDAQEAYRLGMEQFDYYERLVEEDQRLRLILTTEDLDAVLATWEPGVDIRQRQQGLVLLMENADPISEPKQFEEWYARGLRIVGPAWMASRYSGGTGEPGPLTGLGHELLDAMMGFNAMLDLSHIAETAFFEALDQYEGPVIASHSNPRRFCDTDRHLSDAMIRRLAERDGVMGTVLWNQFLDTHWTPSDGKRAITLSTVIDVIDHVCQVTGSSSHIGIGTDIDGGFGADQMPLEIDTIADLWSLQDALQARGFSAADIEAVMQGNMLRKLRQTLAD